MNERKCRTCKETKSLEFFSKDSSNKSGFQCVCKICASQKTYYDPNVDPKTTTKVCVGECSQEKCLIEFSMQKTGKYGRANICIDCRKIDRRKKFNNEPPKEGTKICIDCKTELNVSKFSTNKYAKKDGLRSTCKKCAIKRGGIIQSKFEPFIKSKLRDCKNRIKKKAKRNIIIPYEIDAEFIKELYEKQNGKCALTGIQLTHNALNDRKDGDEHILNKYNLSIDQIEPSKGYIKDNVQLVCAIVNRIKFDLTTEKLLKLTTQIAEPKIPKKVDYENIMMSEEFEKYVHYKVQNAEYGATARNLEFDIDEDDIANLYKKQKGLCTLTKQKLDYDKKKDSLSIDRIDSNKGYTTTNIHLILESVNKIRSDIPLGEFKELCVCLLKNHK